METTRRPVFQKGQKDLSLSLSLHQALREFAKCTVIDCLLADVGDVRPPSANTATWPVGVVGHPRVVDRVHRN